MSIERLTELSELQKSFSSDAIKATSYLDDYIVRGNVFFTSLLLSATESTAIYYTSEILEASQSDLDAVFLLPIDVTPVSGYSILKIYEDTEYTGGTAITPVNRNRTSGNVSVSTIKGNATGSNKGTLISQRVFGTAASTSGISLGGGGGSSNSKILDKTKRYLYELTNSEDAIVGVYAEYAEI